jgi:hypothetical protein
MTAVRQQGTKCVFSLWDSDYFFFQAYIAILFAQIINEPDIVILLRELVLLFLDLDNLFLLIAKIKKLRSGKLKEKPKRNVFSRNVVSIKFLSIPYCLYQ